MNYEILYGPSYSLARVKLEAGEQIQAESGAMVSMSSGVEMQTSVKGGLLSGLKRSVLGGESFFINTFRLLENLDLNPAADRILMNIIRYVQNDADRPLAPLPDDFKARLETLW